MRELHSGGYNAAYVPSGHLVFMSGDSLMAVGFDLHEVKTTPDSPVAVLNDVLAPVFAVSGNGDIAYVEGRNILQSVPVWIDRSGEVDPLPIAASEYGTFDLSPDNSRLAIEVFGAGRQVLIFDVETGLHHRLTSSRNTYFPVWAPDGERLAFSMQDSESWLLAMKEADASAITKRIDIDP